MKYTRSKDGVYRANLRATMRVTHEEAAEIRAAAKQLGWRTLSSFLDYCLKTGYWAESNDENRHLDEPCDE